MNNLWQDLRYGARMLWKSPGFTFVAMLSLAIGIGANTTIFSLVNAALLRPPSGIKDAGRLVDIHGTAAAGNERFHTLSYPDYLYYRNHNEVFDGMTAYSFRPLSLKRSGEAKHVFGMIVTGNYFSVLDVRPALGRFFLPEEDRTPNTHPVAVMSYALWQREFGGDPGVIGRTLTLNGHACTVIGVAPQNFRGTIVYLAPEVWVPMQMQAQAVPGSDLLGDRGTQWLTAAGRLKTGVSIGTAQAAMSILARQLADSHPDTNRDEGISLTPASSVPGEVRGAVVGFVSLLMGVVGLVLLIACANVAGLFLARASARRQEVAIRMAVGANRGRLVRQLLTESVLLFLAGGTIGVLLAVWTNDLLPKFLPSSSAASIDLNVDVRVLSFTLMVSLLTGILFGLAPALEASKPDVIFALKSDTAGAGSRRSRTRNLFVVAQIAVSLVLLIGAGLFVRSLRNAGSIDPGFNPDGVYTVAFDLAIQGYDEERGREFYGKLIERVETLPGVRAAGLAALVPLAGGNRSVGINVGGHEPPPGQRSFDVGTNSVDPRYFRTVEVPVLRGRNFTDADRRTGAQVAVVNETMARRFYGSVDAVGKRFTLGAVGGADSAPVEIIGVVKDGKYVTLGEEPRPHIYRAFEQAYHPRMTLHVRTAPGDAAGVIAAVRREAQLLDGNLPLTGVTTMTEQIGFSLIPLRFAASVVGTLGLIGLLLAGVGIFGVVSYSVAGRTREIGIRMALGAQPRDVLRLVVRQGMSLALVGVGIGLPLAFASTRALASLLYGVSATDPLVFVGIALLLVVVALVASYIPARRATRVEPVVALRYE